MAAFTALYAGDEGALDEAIAAIAAAAGSAISGRR